MDLFFLAAVVLLVGGVVGSVVPLVPGAGLSLAGIYLYWWSSGYATPGPWVLAGFTLVGLAAVVTDQIGGALAAGAGGASTATSSSRPRSASHCCSSPGRSASSSGSPPRCSPRSSPGRGARAGVPGRPSSLRSGSSVPRWFS